MNSLLSVLPDYAGSLALLAILALAYGHLHRVLVRPWIGEGILGACFGAIAIAEMNLPLEPMPGLIIDMRNVPIVLCAAFLNWRATVICLAMAMTMRLHIGGVGMTSGLIAMVIAAAMGTVWAALTRHLDPKTPLSMVLLSVMASGHLFAAVILPPEAQAWFLANAALPIFVLNLVSITCVGLLIEAEHRKINAEARLRASVAVDPEHGVLPYEAMARDLDMKISAGLIPGPAGLMIIQVEKFDTLRRLLPRKIVPRVLGMVQARLRQEFPEPVTIGSLGQDRLVVPLGLAQMRDPEQMRRNIERCVRDVGFALPDGVTLPVSVRTKVLALKRGQRLPRRWRDTLASTRVAKPKAYDGHAFAGQHPIPSCELSDRLFQILQEKLPARSR